MFGTIELRRRLIDSKIASRETIQGCTAMQINEIESMCGNRLPESYVDFMLNFGVRAGRFMRDVVFVYPAVLTLKDVAKDIVADWEKGKLRLPRLSHVFAMRQGEQFMFFDLGGLDSEPGVFFYLEGRGQFELIAHSFWDIIERELKLSEGYYRLANEDSRGALIRRQLKMRRAKARIAQSNSRSRVIATAHAVNRPRRTKNVPFPPLV